jgi:LmbE family N-acetylglucosaminyl deacetylase
MKNFARRNFLKGAALGVGGLGLGPFGLQEAIGQKDSESDKNMQILCVGAHPGDPEFGCGGTLARFAQAGHNINILYLTRGEASDPTKSYAEMAELRTREAEKSCALLKAKAIFAGQVDANTEMNKNWVAKMNEWIHSIKPDMVFTQWPLDTHPDHQVTGQLTLAAWANSKRGFELYFYEVNSGSETMAFEPTDWVDITGQRDIKKQMMFAHQTQSPQKTYDEFFRIMEDFRGLEAGVSAAEGFIHFKGEEIRSSLSSF